MGTLILPISLRSVRNSVRRSVPKKAANWVKLADTKLDPLSVMNFFGGPYTMTHSLRNVRLVVSALVFVIGAKTIHLDRRSWITKTYFVPFDEVGSGPTTSSETSSKHCVGMGVTLKGGAAIP